MKTWTLFVAGIIAMLGVCLISADWSVPSTAYACFGGDAGGEGTDTYGGGQGEPTDGGGAGGGGGGGSDGTSGENSIRTRHLKPVMACDGGSE